MKLKLKIKNVVMIAIIMISGLLSTASISLAQSGTWEMKEPMPTPRFGLSTCAVDGKIYAFGGYSTDHDLSTVEVYDCATNTWTKKIDMPRSCFGISTCTVDGKIYIIGGRMYEERTTSSLVYEYDPVADTSTRKKIMQMPRCYLSTSVVNGKIYAIGGSRTSESDFYSTVEEYDPTTDTWTTKTPMPEGPRSGLSTSVVNGKIYALGGYNGNVGGISTVEEYDPATDTWTTKTDMPTPRGWLSTSVVNGKIYAIGGGANYQPLSTVEVYDPATDTWFRTKPDMPTARFALSTSEVDGKIYAIGGATVLTSPWGPVAAVEEYNPLATRVEDIFWIQNNPTKFLLHQNYPNPFNPQTMIEYQLPQTCHVRLVVYNLLGQKIATLLDQSQQAGQFNVVWDGKDSYGRVVPSGVYFYRLETENFSEMKRMIMLE